MKCSSLSHTFMNYAILFLKSLAIAAFWRNARNHGLLDHFDKAPTMQVASLMGDAKFLSPSRALRRLRRHARHLASLRLHGNIDVAEHRMAAQPSKGDGIATCNDDAASKQVAQGHRDEVLEEAVGD